MRPARRDSGYSCKENYVVNTQIKGRVKTPMKSITSDYICEPLFSDDSSLSSALGFAAGSPGLNECRTKMKEKLDKITNTEQLRNLLKDIPDNAKRAALGTLLVSAPEEVLNNESKNDGASQDKQAKKEEKNLEKNKKKLLDYLFSNKTVEVDMNQSDGSKSVMDRTSD